MICKLIASVNHLCMLLATTKYMDDWPKETLGKTKESRSAKVNIVWTPREERSLSHPAPMRADPLSRTGKPHATRKAKTTETSTRDQKNGRHWTPRPEPIGHGAWSGGILRVNIGMISRTVGYELTIGVGQFMITQLAKDAPCDKVTSVVCSKTQRTNRARNLSSELSRTRVSDTFCQCTHWSSSTIFVCTS